MQIRDNVRQRRRERIQQLIGQQSNDNILDLDRSHTDSKEPPVIEIVEQASGNLTPDTSAYKPETLIVEPDPELWWKEKQRRLNYDHSGWAGVKGLPPTSNSPAAPPHFTGNFHFGQLMRGFALRLVCSAILFAGIWGWFKFELPGSPQAHDWLVSAVTMDMDFQAVEVWYGQTFGGSPTFFPSSRTSGKTQEVSAVLTPEDTVPPVKGRVVQSFAQSGSRIQVAAAGGSDVLAVYTGRVQQVTKDSDGGVTVLVQHPNRVLTVYGNLDSASVKANDWLETGEKLGQLKTSGNDGNEGVLFFTVQQNGKTLDPAEVVPFD
jgi:stage IV sporulation protein FA